MPLYDFHCLACAALSTQLVKVDATVACPACGSLNLEKLVAPFAFRTATTSSKPEAPPPLAPTPKDEGQHVCTGGCQHGKADQLVKKYLDR